MFDELYLSAPQVACFDNDGEPPVGDPPAGDPPAGDPPVGDPPAGKTFNADDVNCIVEERLARDRKSREAQHKAKYEDLEARYSTLLENKNLSDEDLAKMEVSLEDVRNELRTKEERANHEKQQLQEEYEQQLEQERAAREEWENRFHDSSIQRALQDAAISNDAYNADQVVRLLRPMTKLKPDTDDTTGQETDRFRTVVDFPDHDEKGQEVTFSGTPDEIVKRMKDLGNYANLFKSNVVSGLGANSATGGIAPGANGRIDVRNLTAEQYAKIRKENPELLGL